MDIQIHEKNGLVFRKAHFERRGQISDDDVEAFLERVADALARYKKGDILNLDETFINTFNAPSKQIARRGQETIKFTNEKLNLKEGTKYLATISMDPSQRIPLFLVAKGKSNVCHHKNELEDENNDDFIFHSINGWTTSDVMIRYLDWLSEKN